MNLALAYYGDPILRKKVVPIVEITDEIRQLAENMIETMRVWNGIGLAAPQVHRSLALFVTEVPILEKDGKSGESKWLSGKVRVYINPKILSYSEDKWTNDEGCLSIPKIFAPVIRPIAITVQATNLEGSEFREELFWLEARCVMHENDHINGVLFVDRVKGRERTDLEAKLRFFKKNLR